MGADTKRKEARKRKFGTDTSQVSTKLEAGPNENEQEVHQPPKKKGKTQQDPQKSPITNKSTAEEDGIAADGNDLDSKLEENTPQKSNRFILFIGNLPYTATDESIKKHFAKIQPKSIRHRTEKEGGKSKGFAFLEFEGYDRLKTCLKLYHNSSFDDGISAARKLNVELTAGGGGKGKDRSSKLLIKNERLGEQRKRRAEEEAKQDTKASKRKPPVQGIEASQQAASEDQTSAHNGDIHPSRRSRVAVTA